MKTFLDQQKSHLKFKLEQYSMIYNKVRRKYMEERTYRQKQELISLQKSILNTKQLLKNID